MKKKHVYDRDSHKELNFQGSKGKKKKNLVRGNTDTLSKALGRNRVETKPLQRSSELHMITKQLLFMAPRNPSVKVPGGRGERLSAKAAGPRIATTGIALRFAVCG